MLLDVNVNDVLVVELPGQCDVISAFGTRSEVKLSNINITEFLISGCRIHINKPRVINSTRYKSTSPTLVALTISRRSSDLESLVDEILRIILLSLVHIIFVGLEILSLAV
jgi:hypothetical protein